MVSFEFFFSSRVVVRIGLFLKGGSSRNLPFN